MKKLLVVAVALLAATGAWAQGSLTFSNGAQGVNAPDFVGAGTAVKAFGPTYAAQLYVAPAGTTDQSLFTAVGSPFAYSTLVAQAGYFFGGQYVVPNFATGTTIAVQVRGFNTTQGADFATAKNAPGAEIGFSNIIPVTLGGGQTPDPNLVGLTSFNIGVVPEPSTIALGLIGAAALLLRRRRA